MEFAQGLVHWRSFLRRWPTFVGIQEYTTLNHREKSKYRANGTFSRKVAGVRCNCGGSLPRIWKEIGKSSTKDR